MDRQYGHVLGNPEYGGLEYAQPQMMYHSVGPGQQVVGPPLVPALGGVGGQPVMGGLVGGVMLGSGNASAQGGGLGRGEGAAGNGDALEDLLGPFPAVRIRGLPFEAQMQDIIVFFQGCGVLDVVLLQRGEAIVLFNTVMDCQMALARHRANMGRRYIEVFQAKRYDYYNAISQTWHHNGDSPESRPATGSLARPNHTSSGPTPVNGATVGAGGAASATTGSSGGTVNGGATSTGTTGASTSGGSVGGGRGSDGGPTSSSSVSSSTNERASNSGILKLRGLPFSSTKQDIAQFFEGYSLRSDGIHFVYRTDGRLTGEAFVFFTSSDEARTAHRQKDRSMIGSRYVEIFPSTVDECARLTGSKP